MVETLNTLAQLERRLGKADQSLAYSRKASAAAIAFASIEMRGVPRTDDGGLLSRSRDVFETDVDNLADAARRGVAAREALGREAFEIAQWASHSLAAAAVQQMAVRFASGNGALGALVRQDQDLNAAWTVKSKALLAALSRSDTQVGGDSVALLRRQIADIEHRLSTTADRLKREFPDYAALVNPKPLTIEAIQRLLGPDEALLFWLTTTGFKTYVFAVTRERFDWHTIAIGARDLAKQVAAFRRGLDVDEFQASVAAGKPVMFDLGLAYEFYATLMGPVEPLIKNKHHLLIAATGPLTALPFHLLVTEDPPNPNPELNEMAVYRKTPWLMVRHAVSVLPSVASLQALRSYARTNHATRPLVAFADPVFNNRHVASLTTPRRARARALTTRAYTDFWKGVGVDRTLLSQALVALPDTAGEVEAVAKKLGAPLSDIHLGLDASETTVKRLPLADYRVVYFATHGLVAGDIKGLGEPSLALTLPRQPSAFDDGLLTASEVAQLKLNADWVVLSACNTIAGGRPGAEALSGLARAFFYAGTRALLVSHWAVASNAAVRLTTAAFNAIKAKPGIGRAEALRRAMLAYLNDRSDPRNAYPAYWGPFEIIGEGGAGR